MTVLSTVIYFRFTISIGVGLKKSNKIVPVILLVAFLFVLSGIFSFYLSTIIGVLDAYSVIGIIIALIFGLILGYDHTKSE